ncbi:MAG: hypothetical protein A2Z47_05795 [Thermodesulfovibrio sp. RBG_19FT_COMBO_42_12]|nr:MAG: hypothetical protein A2Z47_05795 [Thermodesulfovibrio sp. RBG_19FT_COMBO_42_12]HZX49092.1 hypothetical protein [Nitrospirota bacterium]
MHSQEILEHCLTTFVLVEFWLTGCVVASFIISLEVLYEDTKNCGNGESLARLRFIWADAVDNQLYWFNKTCLNTK